MLADINSLVTNVFRCHVVTSFFFHNKIVHLSRKFGCPGNVPFVQSSLLFHAYTSSCVRLISNAVDRNSPKTSRNTRYRNPFESTSAGLAPALLEPTAPRSIALLHPHQQQHLIIFPSITSKYYKRPRDLLGIAYSFNVFDKLCIEK